MFTKIFWKDTLERAINTFAQSFGAFLIANGTGLFDVEWKQAFSIAALSFIVSVSTSMGGNKMGDTGTASLVKLKKDDK